MAALTAENYRVRRVVPGPRARHVQGNRYEADFASPESLAELHRLIGGAAGDIVGGIINLLGLCEPYCRADCTSPDEALRVATWYFNAAKEFAADICLSAEEDGGWLLNFTALGGKFGIGSEDVLPLAATGTLGMTKTLAKEWSGVRGKNIDLDPSIDPQLLLARVLDELSADDEAVEVGLAASGRFRIDLVPTSDLAPIEEIALDQRSVVLVTGGAYGITADIAKALADRSRAKLIIVGRSPLPADEPAETRVFTSEGDLRKHLIATMRQGNCQITPAAIERNLRKLLKDRQIRKNLVALQAAASSLEYVSLDVRDAAKFGELLDGIYQRYGRLDGVLHGAGVVEDKLLRDKTVESFTNVFTTKVHSASTLAAKLRPETLQFVMFFSSVSGRFGNAGQIDYSAANEYLNKLAQELNRRWPGRVVAVNWGPWDAGMVSEELRRLYATKGVYLIPLDEGVRFALAEIGRNDRASAETIVSCSVEQIASIGLGVGQ